MVIHILMPKIPSPRLVFDIKPQKIIQHVLATIEAHKIKIFIGF